MTEIGAPARSARMISRGQSRKLHALYRDLGITDRADRLADMSDYLARDVGSSAFLTLDEAKLLIDHLERRLAA